MITRRRFVERLGLGAGAALLSPLVHRLVAEAGDDLVLPRRVVFVVEGCGMDYRHFTPAGILGRDPAVTVDTADFALRPMMAGLERYRDRTLLIGGLSNDQGLTGSGHSTGYACLSTTPNDPPSEIGRPGGETLDQFLGRTAGAEDLFRTVGLGVGKTSAARIANISASARHQAVPLILRPRDAYDRLFGPALGDGGGSAADQAALFDLITGDIQRVRRRLAGAERAKLDQILTSIETITRREARLRERADALAACGPAVDLLDADTLEGRLEAHFELTAAALICGLSRVVTIGSACGFSYFDVPFARLGLGSTKHQMGHGHFGGLDSLDVIHDFHAQQIARLCDRLAAIPEGDGSMLDNTLVVWTNENGEQHHARYDRWPVALIGDMGGALRTGRYVRYPLRGQPGARTLADLWCTVSHTMGVPRDDFGAAGLEPVQGPLAALLT